MAQANQSDFLGSGGTFTDPFAGLVSPPSADDFTAIQAGQERQRRAALEAASNQTANINRPYQQQRNADALSTEQRSNADWWEQQFANGNQDPNDPLNQAQYQAAVKMRKLNHDAMNGAGYKAATLGVLAAPAAITGGAAAFGGAAQLGLGGTEAAVAPAAGAGAAPDVVSSAGAPVLAGASPAITTGGATIVPTMAAPTATGAASTAVGTAASSGLSKLEQGLIQGGVGALLPLGIQALTGGRTKEEKALLEKQQQLAEDAQRRQGEVQDARMNTLAQQVLAFNPRNQMLAQMFGPSAAFTPQQAAGMVQGPAPDFDPAIANYQGPDLAKQHQASIMLKRKQQYDASEAARQQAIMNGFQAPGAGPAPIHMPAQQAARKY